MALFRNAGVNALITTWTNGNSDWATQLCLDHSLTAGSTASTEFSVRMGNTSTGYNVYVNADVSGNRLYGGVSICPLLITEYFA